MIKSTSRIAAALLCALLVISLLPAGARAEEPKQAKDISSLNLVKDSWGVTYLSEFFDKQLERVMTVGDGVWLDLEHDDGIAQLYVVFNLEYGSFLLTDNDTGEERRVETHDYLHVYVDVQELFGTIPHRLRLKFDSGSAKVNEIIAYTEGEVPDWVEKWEAPLDGNADLVLFSTHGDDEQLFFAGILPYYAGELDYNVQVVYFTNHRNLNTQRAHEILNGLWAVGVRHYPVLGPFPDIMTNTLSNAYANHSNAGNSQEEMLGYVVEAIRRFKPLVAVGHDVDGEYGHGVHMLYADLLMQAVAISGNPEMYPELAEQYGVWDVPKTYLHLYPQNQIVLDWDQPLENFGGMTAFEVTRDIGFPCHKSQYYGFLWYYTNANNAKQVQEYSPCEYGLFKSTVGDDVQKNDFFENIDRTTRAGTQIPEEPTPPETEPEEVTVPTLPEPVETEPAETTQATQEAVVESFIGTGEGNWLVWPAAGAGIVLVLAFLFRQLSRKKK